MNKKTLKKTKAAAFILLAFASVLSSLQIPDVAADVAVTIEPTLGSVDDTIYLNGTIETEYGFYIVRWNDALNVTEGYADAAGYIAQASFIVPQTAGAPEGHDIPVELIDNATGVAATTTFTLYTEYYIEAVTPAPPSQLQEGANTTIWVNATGGEPDTSYAANITVKDPADITHACLKELTTNATGYGETYVSYPEDFGTNAHTNYTGRYTVAFNETLETHPVSEFLIGLTNATEYTIFQTVNVKAANYTYPGEHAWVNITYNGEIRFSENVSAINGTIQTNWEILANASVGTYTVTITNSTTPGTLKPVNDTQQFIVEKPVFTVQIKAENLNLEPVSNVVVEAHNTTAKVEARSTNETGVATFLLEMDDYSFKVVLKDVEVGVFNSSIMEDKVEDKALTITCNLTNIRILAMDKEGTPMPFISLTANYSYTTRLNESRQETSGFTTNHTGIWNLRNMLTNISYVFEARRYGHIFNQTHIERMSISRWFNLTIILPTFTALIRVVDSKTKAAEGVEVNAYEWSKGTGQPEKSHQTNSDGNATFSLTFGKYRIRAYKDDVLLNETIIDLIQNQSLFIFNLDTLNVDLNVTILDYFGQPIPNAMVKVAKVEQEKTITSVEDTSGLDGQVTFKPLSIPGGNLRIQIYIGGQLSAIKDLYLTNSKQVTFNLSRYVAVAGYAMEISQFVTAIAIAILIVAFIAASAYKRLYNIFMKNK